MPPSLEFLLSKWNAQGLCPCLGLAEERCGVVNGLCFPEALAAPCASGRELRNCPVYTINMDLGAVALTTPGSLQMSVV